MKRSPALRCTPAGLAVLVLLLSSCSEKPTSGGSSATAETDSAAAASSPTSATEPTEPAAFDPDEPVLPGGIKVLSQTTDDFVPLDAGRYGVRVSDTLLYEVDVPDSSEVYNGTYLNPGSLDTGRNGILFIEPADQDTALPVHPCLDHTMKRVGPTVEDLATALSRQPFLSVTTPKPTTVGGTDGLLVQVTIPHDADLSTCQNGRVQILGGIDDPANGDEGWDEPGIVDRMWILDIDGTRHIVHSNIVTGPTVTTAQQHTTAITQMVESITFTHR